MRFSKHVAEAVRLSAKTNAIARQMGIRRNRLLR
jgi:hypothetical protein